MNQVNEQSRWTLFIIAAVAILLISSIQQSKKQEAARAAARKAAEARLAEQAALGEVDPAGLDGTTLEGPGAEGDAGSAITADGAAPAPRPVVLSAAERLARWQEQEVKTVRTESLFVTFGAFGGRVESWRIIDPRYSIKLRGRDVASLGDEEVAEGGEELVTDFPDLSGVPTRPFELSLVGTGRSFHELNSAEWTISVEALADGGARAVLTSPVVRDTVVRKTFTFPARGFDVGLVVDVENRGDQTTVFQHEDRGLGLTLGPSVGPWLRKRTYFEILNAIYYDTRMHWLEPDLDDHRVRGGTTGVRWIGLQNQYFMQALLNRGDRSALAQARVRVPDAYRPPAGRKLERGGTHGLAVETFTDPFTLAPASSKAFEYTVFFGPKSRRQLADVGGAEQLDRAVFYSSWNWFRGLCLGLMWVLDLLQRMVTNWGVAILLLTVLVKLVTHPINHRALRINAEFQRQMVKIKPELEKINAAHKDNAQARYLATRKLYDQHGVSMTAPLRGCLPMLVQLPIFIALYRIFSDYIVLRGASFLWIDDLAAADKFVENVLFGLDLNLLPLVMLGTQVYSMKLSMKVTDPSQRMMFIIMPFMMLIFFYTMPSGLVLYWTMQNVWQIGHTYLTNREVEQEHRAEDAADAVEAAYHQHHPAGGHPSHAGAAGGGGEAVVVPGGAGAGAVAASGARVTATGRPAGPLKTSAATRKKKK